MISLSQNIKALNTAVDPTTMQTTIQTAINNAKITKADTAGKLAAAITINGVSFDGSQNITIAIVQSLSQTLTFDSKTFIATVTSDLIKADSMIVVVPDPAITSAQLTALNSAQIVQTAQAAGTITLKALGTVPTITIPVVLKIIG